MLPSPLITEQVENLRPVERSFSTCAAAFRLQSFPGLYRIQFRASHFIDAVQLALPRVCPPTAHRILDMSWDE